MYHEIELIGNVGKNGVEMRYTQSGKAVASFSLGVNEKYGDKKTTLWFRVSAWERLAEICNEYLKTGSRVLVKGRLTPDGETGNPRIFKRQDGTSGTSYEVSASLVKFLSPKGDDDDQGEEVW